MTEFDREAWKKKKEEERLQSWLRLREMEQSWALKSPEQKRQSLREAMRELDRKREGWKRIAEKRRLSREHNP